MTVADRWPDLLRRGSWAHLPPPVYTALVAQLFGTRPFINIVEMLLVGAIGSLAAWRSHDPWLAGLTWGTGFAIPLLILLRRRFATDGELASVRYVERRFELLGWAISAGIGLMATRAVLATDDTLVHLMMASLALGATSSNIRYHFRPRIAFGKTIAINGPLIAATFLSGNPYYWLLGIAALAATKLFLDITLQLYRGSVAVLLMVQEKEQLAAELEAANASLEQRESERMEAEAALRRLRTDLTQVSRLSAMGTMASTLAHELNQPLTAVVNYVRGSRRLLKTSTQASVAEIAEAMEAAEAGALRAGQIIRRLRRLVYRGRADTRPEDLEALIREACELALVGAQRWGIAHRLELAAEARWANVDHVQVQQVLINLIRNAVEALCDSEHREIVIATRALAGDRIEVSVADTGPGIDETNDGALFTPFLSTKPGGIGIGLSISRTIVEAHGGKIWAANQKGGGAIFRFTLPAAAAPGFQHERGLEAAS